MASKVTPFWEMVPKEQRDLVVHYTNEELDNLWIEAQHDIELGTIAMQNGVSYVKDDSGELSPIAERLHRMSNTIELARGELAIRVRLN